MSTLDVNESLRVAEVNADIVMYESELKSIRVDLRKLHERANYLNYSINSIKKEQLTMRVDNAIL